MTTIESLKVTLACLASEVMYENDDRPWKPETPAERWQRMRNWVERQIKDPEWK